MHDLSDAKYIDLWSLFGALSPESQFPTSSPTAYIYSHAALSGKECYLNYQYLLIFSSSIECTGEFMCFDMYIFHNLIPAARG